MKSHSPLRFLVAIHAIALAAVLDSALPARGDIYTWTNGASNMTWDAISGNWTSGSGNTWLDDVSNSAAVFGTTAAGIVTVSDTRSANSVTFNAGYTLTGGTLTIGTGGFVVNSTDTISSVISGSAGLAKTGTGTLTLAGATSNIFSGDTTVKTGTLLLSKTGGAVAVPGNLTMGDGTANVPYVTMTQPNQFGSSTVVNFANTVNNWARFSLMGNNQILAGVTDSGGGIFQNAAYGQTAPNDATLTFNLTTTNNNVSGFIRDNDDSTTIRKLNIIINGTGRLTLSGTRIYYTGTTTVNGGTLTLQDLTTTGTYGFASNIILGGGTAEFALSGTNAQTYSNTVSGSSGTLLKTGTGTLTLAGAAANTFSGTTMVKQGSLYLNKSGVYAISGPVQMGGGGYSPNLRMSANNQFAPGVVMTFVDTAGNERVDLNGTTQTLAGISDATGRGVIQNQGLNPGEATTAGTLTINNTGDYSFNGYLRDQDNGLHALTLSLVKNGVGTQTLSGGNINYTGTTTVNGGTLKLTDATAFNSPITLNGTIVEFNVGSSENYSQVISGSSGSLLKSGVGTLTLSGASSNTFSGTTTVSNGSLYLNKSGAYAISGAVQMGGGNTNTPNLRMQQNNQFGPGVVMTFANASGYWGRFDLAATNQTLAGLNAGTTTTQGGGVVQNVGPDSVGTGTGTLTLNGSGTYVYNGFMRDQDLGGNTNKFALVMNGTGTQTLVGGFIYYTGATTVNSGTLKLVQTSAFNSAVTIATNAVVEFNLTGQLTNPSGAAPSFTGTGTLRKTGAYQWYLDGGGTSIANLNMAAGGLIDIQEGSIYQGGTPGRKLTTNLGNLNVASVAVFDLYADNAQCDALTGAGTVQNTFAGGGVKTFTVGVSGGSGTFAGVIASDYLALVKTGTGTQTLSGINTYTGGTTISGGTLRLDFSARSLGYQAKLGAISVGSAGTLELYSTNASVDYILVTGNTAITGSGTVAKTGPGYIGLWSDDNTIKDFTGLVDVQQGTLGSNGNGWQNSAGLMDLNIASGASFDVRTQNVRINRLTGAGRVYRTYTPDFTLTVGCNNGTATFSGTITDGSGGGALAFTKEGTGTQTLSGASTYHGLTTVSAGILLVNNTTGSGTGSGSVTVSPADVNVAATLGGTGFIGGPVTVVGNGHLAPGAGAGTLTINNNLTLGADSILDFELAAPNQGITTSSDRIDLTGSGNLVLDGFLNVTELNGFGTPKAGDRWVLFTYTGGLTDHGLQLGSLPTLGSALFYVIDTWTTGHEVDLLIGVPEPSTFALLGLGLTGLLGYGWRRREG